MNGGLGSPVFFFYPPAPYFITSLLYPFFGNQTCWRELGVGAAIGLAASGLCAYTWLRQIGTQRGALISSVLYLWMPYHAAVDLYTRGAYGEFWAFVWMPLLLYLVHKIKERKLAACLAFAVSYAILVMTHLPTTLIFSAILPFYAMIVTQRGYRLRSLGLCVAALAVGVGISAVYLLPALTTQDSVSMVAMRVGFCYYENGFFLPHLAAGNFQLARDHFERELLWIALSALGASACAWILVRRSNLSPGKKLEASFWTAVGFLAVFMMFPVSKLVYEMLSPLQLIQFPWRFNTILAVASSGVLALAISCLQRPLRTADRLPIILGCLFLVWGVSANVKPLLGAASSSGPVLDPNFATGDRVLRDAPEYRPKWAFSDLYSALENIGQHNGELDRVKIVVGRGNVIVKKWRPRHIVLEVYAESSMLAQISQFYYPAWGARLDGVRAIEVRPSNAEGLIRIDIPSGAHLVSLVLRKDPQEKLGQTISAITIGACLFGCIFVKRRCGVAAPDLHRS